MTAPTLTDLGTSYGPTVVPGTCEWTPDDVDADVWVSGCVPLRLFEFNTGGPIANHFAYCPYCGRELAEVRPEAEDEDAGERPADALQHDRHEERRGER